MYEFVSKPEEIEVHQDKIYNDKNVPMDVTVKGHTYYSKTDLIHLIQWDLKQFTSDVDDAKHLSYRLDINIYPQYLDAFIEQAFSKYNGNILELLIQDINILAKRISKLIVDIGLFELQGIYYYCRFDIGGATIEEKNIINALIPEHSLNYREWEIFDTKNTSNKQVSIMAKRFMEVIFWGNFGSFNIRRRFDKKHTLKELAWSQSENEKLIVKSLLSSKYTKRVTAIYSYIAMMGGTFYSYEKAKSIIDSSDVDNRGQLYDALFSVKSGFKGIYDKKKFYEKHEMAQGILADSNALVALGINPVTLPDESGLKAFTNPAREYYNWYIQWANEIQFSPSRIEVEEIIGHSHIPIGSFN